MERPNDEWDVDEYVRQIDEKQQESFEERASRKAAEEEARRPILRRLVNTSVKIQLDPPTMREADFMHSILCQVGMPRKQTDERIFERKSGNSILVLEAGRLYLGDKMVEQPLPYGARPRLVMVHIATQAIKTQSREVEVGRTIRSFLKTLGLDTNSRSYNSFRQQMQALAACRMTLGYKQDGKNITVNTQPIHKFEAWISNDEKQGVMWPGVMELSEDFYNSLCNHAVPLDSRALGALSHSALAIDIYTWLAYRLCQITKPEGIKVSWYALKDQFGQEYTDLKKFRQKFKIALAQVLAEYPHAKVSLEDGGVLMKSSFPPIRKTQIQVVSYDPKNPDNKTLIR